MEDNLYWGVGLLLIIIDSFSCQFVYFFSFWRSDGARRWNAMGTRRRGRVAVVIVVVAVVVCLCWCCCCDYLLVLWVLLL